MILPDVNVLIGAFRSDSPHHAVCNPWLQSEARSDRPFAISPLAMAAVLPITTQARIHNRPSSIGDVLAFAEDFMEAPTCVLVEPTARHWTLFRNLVTAVNARGKLVTDAWFAALAIEHGCEWVTLDDDFSRFPGLRWKLLG